MSLNGKFILKNSSVRCIGWLCAIIFILALTNTGYGQIKMQDSLALSPDSGKLTKDNIVSDSISLKSDTTQKDSTAKSSLEESLGIKISKDALPSVVQADAEDSAVLDLHKDIFYLYGDAKVNYEDMKLNASTVVYSQQSNIVTAAPAYDSNGQQITKPVFTQGNDKYTYDSLQYNFKSKRAIARNAHTQYGEGYVASQQIKRNPDQSIYGLYNVYTTCALDTPHYGIVAKKIKVVPDRVIASGPANIYIEGVPTPLFLPFGLFPISKRQRSGFILPTYTVEAQRGLGLLNGGYYFYLDDHADLQLRTNVFSKGSYGVSAITNYANIYHYKGDLEFDYNYNKTGESYEPTASISRDYKINWRHQTDPKARPGQSFNASVDIITNNFNQNNSYNLDLITQNQYQSNITYSKTWLNKPYSLSISANHNQNTQTRQVNVTLPDINFYVSQINPFQSKHSSGASHWYDKITTSYTLDAKNSTTFYDSLFSFNTLSLSDFDNGIHQHIPISASYNIFRYITTTFAANYDEYWYTKELLQQYNDSEMRIDSTKNSGFYTARDFNASVNLNTKIYGTKIFKKGKLRGIRHTLTPHAGFSYQPDFRSAPFNYYYKTRIDTLNNRQNYQYLFPYVGSGLIGAPPQGKQGIVNFGFDNNLQIKVRSGKDTVTGYRNIPLIDNLNIQSGYNMAVDSFQWQDIAVSFKTNLLEKVSLIATANFDPYAFDYQTGQRLKQTMWDANKGIARFRDAQVSLSANFASKPATKNETVKTDEYKNVMHNAVYDEYVDFNIPWRFNISYSLTVNNNYSSYSKKDTLVLDHYAMFNGEFNITPKWKLGFQSSYSFTQKALQAASLNLYRDLHCWQMTLSTIPFGKNRNYNFTLQVKASVLQDLKIVKRRSYYDNQ
jgi:lipopolysaccharide assembly outer membrane protein LptD (OstA)